MPRAASAVLLLAMVAWTLMTGVAGWYALHDGDGDGASAPSADNGSTELSEHTSEVLSVATAIAPTVDASVPQFTPTPDLTLQFAVPRIASSAGIDRSARSAGIDRPRTAPAPVPSRGVVVLDPGHGRGDPGAVHYFRDGSGGYYTEAESNLRNAELIRDELTAMGYEVYLTREGAGRGPGAPLPLQWITSDLLARVALATAVDADVYLALHGNGARVKSISGPETWYCGKHQEGAANQRLASMVQQAMMEALHEYGYFPPDRGIKEDAATHHSGEFCQFVVTRETPVPAALLEFLFLSNEDDAAVLIDDRSHVLMAQHVAQALDDFIQERDHTSEPVR